MHDGSLILETGEVLKGAQKHSPRDVGMEGIFLDRVADALATLLIKQTTHGLQSPSNLIVVSYLCVEEY